MSYLVIDVMAEYTDRATGNRQIRAQLIADTAADLPSNTTALTWLLGSYAKTVDTGKEYYIDSGGTWIEQPSNNAFDNVYTKAEIDSIINPMISDIDKQENALIDIINSGGKNRFNATGAAQSARGFTLTNNGDGTFTVNGTRNTPDSIWFSLGTIDLNGHYFLSGTNTNTVRLTANVGGVAQYDSGNGADLDGVISGTVYANIPPTVNQLDNVIIYPMICSYNDWIISQTFEPYCPSLAELYTLVKSYHP